MKDVRQAIFFQANIFRIGVVIIAKRNSKMLVNEAKF